MKNDIQFKGGPFEGEQGLGFPAVNDKDTGLVFGASPNQDSRQLAQLFPAHGKLSPANRLSELLRMELWGVR